MPFDGISFSDPGYRATSPAEMNIHAEMSSKTQAKTYIKKLDESHKVNADGKNSKNSQQNKNSEEQNSTKEENKEQTSFEENIPDFISNSKKNKKFKVSFNRISDMVELIDRETGKIIESISPNDLLTLVSKSKTASGILVDRTI